MKIFVLMVAALSVLPMIALADTVRAAVGKPLQQAEALIQKHDYRAALEKVKQAKGVGVLTPYEAVVVAKVGGIAAAGAGEYAQAASAYEVVLNSGTVPSTAKIQYIQAIAGFYDQAKDYPQTIVWVNRYAEAGGSDQRTRVLLAQAYYQEGDFGHAEQAAARDEKAANAAGQEVSEAELQLLASSAKKSGDDSGYAAALEALLKTYPNPQYWAASIASVTALPGFPDSLTLDVYRLRLVTGTLTDPGDYEDYAERAILAGDPAEASTVINKGFSIGILTDQTDAGHAARLRTLATKTTATAHASLASDVQKAQEEAKAGSPHAGLDLGIAYFNAGQSHAAISTFKGIQGGVTTPSSDPEARLAGLWLIYVQDAATDDARNATTQNKGGA